MRCPNCGTESNISTGFCVCCGSPLPETESAENSSKPIEPVLPGENYFPTQPPAEQTVQIAEKLEVDTSFEAAEAERKHKQKTIIIAVVCSVLAVAAIITGIILAVKHSANEKPTDPSAVPHAYDDYYSTLSEIESTGKYFVSTEVSTPDGALRQMKYATDGKSFSVTGIFDDYNVILTQDSLYIISAQENNAALVPDEMLSLCKGFTKDACKLGLSFFGLSKPSSEPIETVNGDSGISCTFDASNELKAVGIYTYISFYDNDGKLKSTEYRNEAGVSVKTVKYNEVSGVFDPSKHFTPDSTLNVYTKSGEVRAFLATIFDEEIQGDITVPGIGLSCSIPSGLFAIFNGVKPEDALRCGFTEINTEEIIKQFPENTYILFSDGTNTIGSLSVFSSSAESYSSVSSMTDVNDALMDYYAASYDSVSFDGNCVYNNIRYAMMQGKTSDGRCSIIFDTVQAGLHLKFIFTYTSAALASEARESINTIIKSISINSSAITEKPTSEYQSYSEQIDDYGISCTVPSGWFSVSAQTTQSEAAALGFSAVNIDTLKNLLEPDGGIFAVLCSPQASDNITCEFYAANEPNRDSLDSAQLNICKTDIQDFYKEKYGSSAAIEETVRYNNAVYFIVNCGNKLIYETVYGGYYYVFSFNTATITDSARNLLREFTASVSYNPSTITAVPSVFYARESLQSYIGNIGETGLSCTVPAGWFAVGKSTRETDAAARGFRNLNVSDYTTKIRNSERLVSCVVCAQSGATLEGAEIDISEFSYSSKNFASMSEQEFSAAAETFKGYYVDVFNTVEYSGTVSFNGLKYVIISAFSSGKGVRIYETVHNGINYTIYMEGSAGALSPTELSLLNSFVSSVTP